MQQPHRERPFVLRPQADARFLEELGTYDPMVPKTDDRVKLVPARIKYWMSQGALPSEKCAVLFKKYMAKWEQAAAAPAGAGAAAPAEAPPATS